jgi:exosome complex component RRP4
MQMRNYFEENDLLSGEVQQVHQDGGVNIQTRNLKYGKVTTTI